MGCRSTKATTAGAKQPAAQAPVEHDAAARGVNSSIRLRQSASASSSASPARGTAQTGAASPPPAAVPVGTEDIDSDATAPASSHHELTFDEAALPSPTSDMARPASAPKSALRASSGSTKHNKRVTVVMPTVVEHSVAAKPLIAKQGSAGNTPFPKAKPSDAELDMSPSLQSPEIAGGHDRTAMLGASEVAGAQLLQVKTTQSDSSVSVGEQSPDDVTPKDEASGHGLPPIRTDRSPDSVSAARHAAASAGVAAAGIAAARGSQAARGAKQSAATPSEEDDEVVAGWLRLGRAQDASAGQQLLQHVYLVLDHGVLTTYNHASEYEAGGAPRLPEEGGNIRLRDYFLVRSVDEKSGPLHSQADPGLFALVPMASGAAGRRADSKSTRSSRSSVTPRAGPNAQVQRSAEPQLTPRSSGATPTAGSIRFSPQAVYMLRAPNLQIVDAWMDAIHEEGAHIPDEAEADAAWAQIAAQGLLRRGSPAMQQLQQQGQRQRKSGSSARRQDVDPLLTAQARAMRHEGLV